MSESKHPPHGFATYVIKPPPGLEHMVPHPPTQQVIIDLNPHDAAVSECTDSSGKSSNTTPVSGEEIKTIDRSHNRYKRAQRIQCINCGIYGHTAKKCNEPVTSYGIICYKVSQHSDDEAKTLQYLMIQKKDSLSYVEFVRGKYDIANREYLIKLASNMTPIEKHRLRQHNFETIWQMLWTNDMPQSKKFMANFMDSRRKFERLQRGFSLKHSNGTIAHFDLNIMLDNATNRFSETEWEFPKGRRQINECDEDCAMREFYEETGIPRCNILLHWDIKPLEEVFVGVNKVRYRHIYYIATIASPNVTFNLDLKNTKQCGEVRDIGWFSVDGALEKTRHVYIERKEILMRVHRTLNK